MSVTVHLVAGSTGAGKTTYALALAAREGAIRLSIDERMTALLKPDQPEPLQFEWMMERVNRCESQMWTVALQASALGVPVVVDCGLTRDRIRAQPHTAASLQRLTGADACRLGRRRSVGPAQERGFPESALGAMRLALLKTIWMG